MVSANPRQDPSPHPPPSRGGGERNLSPARYLLALGATSALALALIWLFVLEAPLAFLDPEYPYWLAKQQLLQSCDLGTVLVVGDSRAAVDIIPARLGVTATNLAVGGGEAIEAYAALRRALACPNPPRRVVISFDAAHFVHPDLFWDRSVRFGAVDLAELTELRAISERLGDASVLDQKHADGLPRGVRALLYAVRFPSLYFNSLLKGGVLLRWWDNRAALRAGLASRGQYFFGTAAGSSVVAADGHLENFTPLPVLDTYFDCMLALLAARHIETDFVSMPLNAATWRAVHPALRDGFAAYLAGYAARYPNFHVIGPLIPAWDDGWFGDEFAHLNPTGAALFSARFGDCLRARLGKAPREAQTEPAGAAARELPAEASGEAATEARTEAATEIQTEAATSACAAFDQPRLQDAPPSTQNAAQWGWFNATAPEASANVAPISKRGS
jgi:hypothetical protein